MVAVGVASNYLRYAWLTEYQTQLVGMGEMRWAERLGVRLLLGIQPCQAMDSADLTRL
jgi:hypothetical protein